MSEASAQAWLPLLVVAVVMALRWRSMSKPRRLRPDRLLIAPPILTVLIGLVIFTQPISPLGWAALAAGVGLGAFIGWRRAHMMHLERDPQSGDLMLRPTPAALLLLAGLFVVKRLIAPAPGAETAGHLTPHALIATDALMGFGLAMIWANALTLWQRARAVPHPQPAGAE